MDATPTERTVWVMLAIVIASTVGLVGGIILSTVITPTPPAVCQGIGENGPIIDCDYSNGSWYPTEDTDPIPTSSDNGEGIDRDNDGEVEANR